MQKIRDMGVSIGVVLIVLALIIPFPTWMLDLFQMINITLAILILLSTMYVNRALDLSSFPSILLIMTLFRLSLNVSSTRLILLQGPKFQGRVIRSFGNFVVGGDIVVGIIVFLILVIIQFIVITKGAERIAEVAARFTLDAMPGKQMSVDADYNAGLINEAEARKRREDIRREADFYGSMDGASKFVKGDAIAGLIITFIDIVAGLIIGITKFHMTFARASQTFMIFTIGDGLSSQIPALIISTATGLIVSRAASSSNLGQTLVKELGSQNNALIIAGFIIIAMSILTPLPTIWGLLLGGLLLFVGYSPSLSLTKAGAATEEKESEEEEESITLPSLSTPEEIANIIQVDTVEIEIGYELIPMANASAGGDLMERITMIRRQIAMELGSVIRPIRVRDSMLLKPTEYVIKIKGSEVTRYSLMPDKLMAMNPGTAQEPIEGIEAKEPAFNLTALWIDKEMKEKAESLGYTVVDPSTVFATHLTETLKKFAHEILGRKEMEMLIEALKQREPKLVEELIPENMKLTEVQEVLKNLLKEEISIRNLEIIFETLLKYSYMIKDIDVLTEYVRYALARNITDNYKDEEGKLNVIILDPQLEDKLISSLEESGGEKYLNINPEVGKNLIESISKGAEQMLIAGFQPVLLVSPTIRPYIRKYIERNLPNVPVLSYKEVTEDVEVKIVYTASF